jgi:serine-type D-Ala-D-Ala carboxypeptidase
MPNSSDIISSFLKSEISLGSLPGGQYLVGEDLCIFAEGAVGLAVIEPERIPATLDTIYDLASLTKPLITALLAVKSAERGELDLNAPLAAYLWEFNDKEKREITLTQLLTHTSGLPNWRPLYIDAPDRATVPEAIARILLEPSPLHDSREVIYSDLNYILLGFVLERVLGDRIDRVAKREIFDPLGLERTMFNPPAELLREIAATEHGQEFELANAIADAKTRNWRDPENLASPLGQEVNSRASWRTGLIWGEVHDGNANFMGGVAGHAGLFSTARETFRMANQFLPGSELLKPESLHLFFDNLTPDCVTSRSIAWIIAETPNCSAGPALPPTALGHNGFTGTSIWMDPSKRRVFVLLTNRVHPRVDAIDMRQIRQRFNALSVETAER